MSRKLPPLNSLRAFEAAARQLSFKKAAEELYVTPAAVSHQIRTLEEYCAAPLFHRLARALRLPSWHVAGTAGRSHLETRSRCFETAASDCAMLPISEREIPMSFSIWSLRRLSAW